MTNLIAAVILIGLALIAIPILLFLLKGARSILRVLFEIGIGLLLLCGIALLIVYFVV